MLSDEEKKYVYAESIFVFEQLSRTTQYKMLETDRPIGLLWKDEKLETFREVQGYKIESSEAVAFHLNVEPDAPILSRSYTICNNKKIMGVITEKIPLDSFVENV